MTDKQQTIKVLEPYGMAIPGIEYIVHEYGVDSVTIKCRGKLLSVPFNIISDEDDYDYFEEDGKESQTKKKKELDTKT